MSVHRLIGWQYYMDEYKKDNHWVYTDWLAGSIIWMRTRRITLECTPIDWQAVLYGLCIVVGRELIKATVVSLLDNLKSTSGKIHRLTFQIKIINTYTYSNFVVSTYTVIFSNAYMLFVNKTRYSLVWVVCMFKAFPRIPLYY